VCIDENPDYKIEYTNCPQIICITFHPEILNSSFHFEKMEDRIKFSPETVRNSFSLAPFWEYKDLKEQILELAPRQFLRIKELISNIQKLLQNQEDSYWPCKSRSYLMELLFLTRRIHIDKIEQNQPEDDMATNDEFISEIILFLHSNYYQKITIDDISREFSTNRTTLSKIFKKSVGKSIISYLIDIRMQIAGKIVINTSCTIQEISERVGYKDITHFSRHFKAYYSECPSKYRNISNQKQNKIKRTV